MSLPVLSLHLEAKEPRRLERDPGADRFVEAVLVEEETKSAGCLKKTDIPSKENSLTAGWPISIIIELRQYSPAFGQNRG